MENKNITLFGKENLRWMIVGAVVIILGLFLMVGGKSEDPNIFEVNEVYGTMRITVAPILIMVGLIIEIFAIMRKEKSKS
jgi:hypothetical protein